jgi:hypothetical protein
MSKHREVLLPRSAGRDPEHLVYADLHLSNGHVVKRVLCEVFLPRLDSAEVLLRFYPTTRQAAILRFCPSFHANAKFVHGGHRCAIQTGQVWSNGLASGTHDGIPFITTFEGRPEWLELTLGGLRRKSARVVAGVFRLTPTPIINTAIITTSSYTGAVHVRRVAVPQFTLQCGLRLKFQKHFETLRNDSGQDTKASHVAASFRSVRALRRSDFPHAVAEFDRFLTLISFASRYHSICLRWDFGDRQGTSTRHYRQNITAKRPRTRPR